MCFEIFKDKAGESHWRGYVQKIMKSLLIMAKDMKKNHSIGIFPEGTRNRNPGELKKGQKGIGKIVLKTGIPMLLIGVNFSERNKQGKSPKFGSLI